jgi:hypothetical protein
VVQGTVKVTDSFAILFTIAKLWKQTRCLTTDEWIKKIGYTYRMDAIEGHNVK